MAVAAGAGVVGQLVGLDPAAPFRNITSGSSPVGIQSAGFSDDSVTQTFMDAMPIECSHPVLPSTVLPGNFRVHLNTGEVVAPLYVARNPNYDFNERQAIVAFYTVRFPNADAAGSSRSTAVAISGFPAGTAVATKRTPASGPSAAGRFTHSARATHVSRIMSSGLAGADRPSRNPRENAG